MLPLRRHRVILGALIAALALALPASASARTTSVVPFATVAGVPLQLTPAQVLKRLGKPSHVIRVSGRIAQYDYSRLALTVEFDTLHHPDLSDFVGVAVGFATPKIDYHTVDGIHIGTTRAAVRRALGARCHFSSNLCTLYRGTPGAIGSRSFALVFENGRVQSMDNQIVLNDA